MANVCGAGGDCVAIGTVEVGETVGVGEARGVTGKGETRLQAIRRAAMLNRREKSKILRKNLLDIVFSSSSSINRSRQNPREQSESYLTIMSSWYERWKVQTNHMDLSGGDNRHIISVLHYLKRLDLLV